MATSLKTIRTEQVGKTTVRLLQGGERYIGAVIPAGGKPAQFEGDDPDVLWRKLLGEVGRAHPDYFGFDGAMLRFLRNFPKGFADEGYAHHERIYKDEAVAKIGGMLPLEAARQAGPEQCAAAVRAFQATNLVFQVEKARIKEVLLGAKGSAFLASAARFADGEPDAGLAGMVDAIGVSSQPSWPMLTYLPFMWRPDRHIFLKPQVTRDFADRVGHSFGRDYDQGFAPAVYDSLLDLADETHREIASLQPRDLIDVQSFIWVVGTYTNENGVED